MTLGIDEHGHAKTLEQQVFRFRRIGKFDCIRKTRAAAGLHRKPQAYSFAAVFNKLAYAFCRAFGQGDCNDALYMEKELPQPQVVVAFGFLMRKRAPSRPSS